ncbi:XdhC family protein [Zestomonas carbonaria]|uniref:Putative xanthine dehydrogenase subunit A n=1 Tax=Zestomonas carbonaria TaxID=2762745 RepID=A0A7U7EIX6_9GAMM|nr:XdhC/CoxI family protein [Pseudomonas carbonaria]CAD5105899.1 putative xanthine dehydrogenase subunit A [Pseudomonas carbonaria]
MSDLPQLLGTLDALAAEHQDAVMATVVKVEGSAYRRPGARMLIPRLGHSVGTVSGGCLEQDLARKAWWLTESGVPVIREYSTGMADDEGGEEAELMFGLGCNGTVHILLERIQAGHPSLPVELLRKVRALQKPAALATVIGSTGNIAAIGERAAIDPTGAVHLAAGNPTLADALQADLQETLAQGRSTIRSYALENGLVEVLLEYLPAPRRLVIFGAGHDAQPLVRMAKQQDWYVCVIDARPHFARKERFPEADEVRVAPLEQPFALHAQIANAAVAIMTHSYAQDRHWLEQALRHAPLYIGQLGPRSRTERLLDDMEPPCRSLPAYADLHYPIGLDIGGDTPESVALSILAEITAHLNRRDGGMLKQRRQPIHMPEAELYRSLATTRRTDSSTRR